MADRIPKDAGPLHHYEFYLKPIYEEISGDSATYYQVEGDYRTYLERQAEKLAGIGGWYTGVLNNTALPAQAISSFREFLAGGLNAAESLPIKQEMKALQSQVVQILTQIERAPYTPSLYELWLHFRANYLDEIDILDRLLMAAEAPTTGGIIDTGRQSYANPLNTSRRHQIFKAVYRLHMLGSEALAAFADKVQSFKPDNLEHALIRSQLSMLGSLHKHIFNAMSGLGGSKTLKTADFLKSLGGLHSNWRILKNPFYWTYRLSKTIRSIVGEQIQTEIPENLPALKHNRPHALLDTIDRLIMLAIHYGTPFNIQWDKKEKAMVFTSPRSLRPLMRDQKLTLLTAQLGAVWEMPTTWESWRSTLLRKKGGRIQRLIIPLMTTNETPPATPSEPPKTSSTPGNGPAMPPPAGSSSNGQGTSAAKISGFVSPQDIGRAETTFAPANANRWSALYTFCPSLLPNLFAFPAPMMSVHPTVGLALA